VCPARASRPATRRTSRARPAARSRSTTPKRRRPSAARRRAQRRRRLVTVVAGLAIAGLAVYGASRLDYVQSWFREAFTLPLRHDDIIRQQAAEKGVAADLIAAVIWRESKFDENAVSAAGARGLMQITPDTARYIERLSGGTTFRVADLTDPDINIRYGTYYLGYLLDKYGGNEVAAIAAYNAGESNVDSWGGSALTQDDIQFPETRAYVAQVLEKRSEYRRYYSSELGL
jgi:peptidoglycan lytic transglycosylase